MSRHRWKATSDHFYPGPKPWVCIKCGLQKITEYECVTTYRLGGREWRRYAPPCPPDTDEGAAIAIAIVPQQENPFEGCPGCEGAPLNIATNRED